MAVFTKIEIHFIDPVAGERRAVIMRDDPVQAVFLRGAEDSLPFMKDVKREVVTEPPGGVTLEGRVRPQAAGLNSARGPGGVCYLVNGVLQCWKPD